MLRRINTPKRGLALRALALVLAFALVLPLNVVFMQVQAADEDRPLVDGKDLYTRVADANTMDSYAQALLGGFVYLNRNGGFSGTDRVTSPSIRNNFGSRFAGEVWADKSVFARYQPNIAGIRPFEEGKSYISELTELNSLGIDISGVTAGKPLTADQAEELNNAVNALMENYLSNFNPDNPTASGYKFQGDGDFDGRTLQLERYTDGVNSSVTMNDDSDFLHVFSALGSSQVVDYNVPLPLDVVFVLDTSSTMAKSWGAPDELRLWKAGKALNDAFDAVLENENNRVALVTYDTNANVALPLNRYTPLTNKDENERYFIVTDNKQNNAHRNITLNVKDIGGTLYTENYTVDSGTNTHQGLYEGMKILAEEKTITSAVDTALGKMQLQRIPVVILLSDGEPSFVTTAKGELAFRGPENTEGVKTGDITDWWEPENPYRYSVTAPDREQLVGFPSGHSWGLALPVFLMAAHMKQEINKNYFKTDSPQGYPGVQIITVGIDPDAEGERSGGDWRRVDLMKTTLNPKDQLTEEYIANNIENPKAGYAEYTEKLYEAVKCYLDPEYNLEALRLGVDEHNNWATIKRPGPTDKVNPITWDGVRYNDQYLDVDADELAEALPDLISGLTFSGTVFNPISGTNATGISNSITYEDPIGEYMAVDDVTDVTMFGEHYKVRKRAVYDYEANLAIRGENPLIEEGWYDSDNHYYGKDVPAGFTADNVWENGFTYRITYLTAQDYVPTLTNEGDEAELSEKQQNTTYTIYSITEQYARPDSASTDNNEKWRINKKETKKILEEDITSRTRTNLSYTDEDDPDGVKFDLLEDIKIWVEDTGEYRDVGIGDFIVEEGYSEALFINISTEALPIQLASINCRLDNNVSTPVEYATNINDTWASTPLRVYYDVSFDRNYLRYQTEEYTKALNKEYAVGVALTEISSEYLEKNTSTVFTKGNRQTAFYSGYFTDSTYNEYPVTVAAENISRGNAAVTFAASNDNQFYRFQKDRVLFLIPGVNESEARPVEVDLGSETEVRKIDDPTTVDGLQTILNQARRDNHTYYSRYDCIPVTGARDTKVKDQDGNELIIEDQISSDNWYYIIREYYVPLTLDGDGKTKNVERRYRAIARKGSEFGSGLSKGGSMGSEVQWYNPNLPYGENTSPFQSNEEHWGRPGTEGDRINYNDGWYVAARPGGLRVGGMENFVGTKGYDIREGADIMNFEKDPAVIGKANLTDTALSYVVPAISSYTGNDEENVAVNLYLGNNGRILVDDTILIMTKTVNSNDDDQYSMEQQTPGEKFKYRVEIEGFYGARGAVMLTRDEFDHQLWRRRFDTIDLLTDNRELLLADDNNLAMVDSEGHRVFEAAGEYYYYNGTKEDGTFKTDGGRYTPSNDGGPYYAYLGQNIRRGLYNDKTLRVFKADVTKESGTNEVTHSNLYGNQSLRGGRTFYLTEEQYQELPAETREQGYVLRAGDNDTLGIGKTVIFRIIDENSTEDGHNVGDREYWVNRVYLIPVTKVDNADAGDTPWAWEYSEYEKVYSASQNFDDIDFATDDDWRTGYGNGAVTEQIPYTLLTEFTVATLRTAENSGAISETKLVSEGGFGIRSNYLTTPVTFNEDGTATVWLADGEGLGFNNINFGSDYAVTEILEQDDIYFPQVSHVQEGGGSRQYYWQNREQADKNKKLEITANLETPEEYTVVGNTNAYEQAVHYTNYYLDDVKFEPEPGEEASSIPMNSDTPSDKLAGDVPKTGDDSQIRLWMALLGLSIGAVAAIASYYIKKTRPFRPKDKDQNN